MKRTAKEALLECAASWPGITVQQLIDEEELTEHSKGHLIQAVGELRRMGHLCPHAYPAVLHVKFGWQDVVDQMWKRDQAVAAAIASGAHTYRALGEVLSRSKTSLYHSGARLIKAGAVYNPRGLYLTEMGAVLFAERMSNRRRAGAYSHSI